MSHNVRTYVLTSAGTPKPMTRPATIAATKTPLPGVESQLKLKTAASGVGFTTTGGTRATSSWRPATGIFTVETLSSRLFTGGRPQTKTNTARMIQGAQARRAMPGSWRDGAALGVTAAAADNVAPTASGQTWAGCQIRRKAVSAAIETSAETTSTSSGPL